MLLQKRGRKERETLDAIREMEKILSSLANEDALKIFIKAGGGIESSTQVIKELNITQKRYYIWLKRLIDAGLIEKRGKLYVQTMLGKICYKFGKATSNALEQRDQLELADKLMRSDTFSIREKEEVLRAISKKELFGTARLMDVIHEVKMIADYEDFADEVIKMLKNAKKCAYTLANKFDARIMEATFEVIDRGIKFYFLSSEDSGYKESIKVLKMLFLHPQMVKTVRGLLETKELNIRLLEEKLAYSFVVVDGEYGIIELPHPSSPDFYVAFKFKNVLFCQKLIETFNSLYERGREDPRISFARRYLSFRK